jgi:carbonic anhydrase
MGRSRARNAPYVDAVARANVVLGLGEIRRRNPMLGDLETKGTVKITGAMYDLSNGMVDFVG